MARTRMAWSGALLAAALSCSLHAASKDPGGKPGDDQAQVVRYGLYRLPSDRPASTSQGMLQALSRRPDFIRTTDAPSARLGAAFGYEFLLPGRSLGDRDGWWVVILHPPMKKPGAQTPSRTSFEIAPKPTKKGLTGLVFYGFDRPDELLAGRWTLQLTHRGKVVMEKAFTVAVPAEDEPRGPAALRAACAQEIGLFCNAQQEDLSAAVRCLKAQSDSLLPPCRQALGL